MQSNFFPEPRYLEVGMYYYQFIPKDKIQPNLIGFATENVCECVCGLISSNEAYAFFHFQRLNDAQHLAELIHQDFKNAIDIKLTLIGGNLGNCFLPWKAKDRNVALKDADAKLFGTDAIDRMKTLIAEINEDFTFCISYDRETEIKALIRSAINENSELSNNNLITYNFAALNEKLASSNFQVYGFDFDLSFNVRSVNDFVAYQNLSRVFKALISDSSLFNETNVTHYHSPIGDNVFAKFNGTCGAYSSNKKLSYPTVKNLFTEHCKQIENQPQTEKEYASLNKQNIIPALKFK